MVDRRGIKRKKLPSIDERVADRYKFSCDSSEDEQIYPVDWTDNLNIRYRIMIDRQEKMAQAAQAAQLAQNRRAIAEANNNRPSPYAIQQGPHPTRAG